MTAERWFHALVVVFLIVLGVIVRWTGLAEYALSPDDALILGIAQSETLGKLFENAMREVHPPLFYIVLRIVAAFGESEAYLRGAMMGIGLASVPVVYATGLRFVGKVGAIVMALIPALSIGAVLETTSLRHYPLVILISSIGWYLFLRYRESKSSKILYAYAVVVLLGVLTHYSQLLLFSAFGITHLIGLSSAKATRRDAIRFVVVQLPAALVALFFVWTHVAAQWTKGQGHYDYIVKVAYAKIFPKDLAHWVENTLELGTWLSFPNLAGLVAIGFAVIGLVMIPIKRGVAVLAVILCVIGFQLAGTLASSYPFGPTRHCLYLLPLFAFAFGFGVHTVTMWFLKRLEDTWIPSMVGGAIAVVAGLFFTYDYIDNETYRTEQFVPAAAVSGAGSRYWSHASFPVKRADHAELFGALERIVRPGMHIITNRQSSMYLRRAVANISGTQVRGELYKVSYRDAAFYYRDDRSVEHVPQGLRSLVVGVVREGGLAPTQPVFLFTVGWNQAVIELLAHQANLGPKRVLALNSSGALVQMRLDRLLQVLPE
jgi:hypothetical protein